MITRWLPFLNTKKIILASGSLQRKLILEDLGLQFQIKTSDFEENLEKTNSDEYVTNTCYKKLEKFIIDNKTLEIDIIIAADTIVEKNGKIYEKPRDKDEIMEWFSLFSNNYVICTTSVCIAIIKKDNDKNEIFKFTQFLTKSIVYFGDLSKDIILDYIDSGEPFNKAGGFAIQGLARTLIKKIDGCYYNVMGFPAYDFAINLIKFLEEFKDKI